MLKISIVHEFLYVKKSLCLNDKCMIKTNIYGFDIEYIQKSKQNFSKRAGFSNPVKIMIRVYRP